MPALALLRGARRSKIALTLAVVLVLLFAAHSLTFGSSDPDGPPPPPPHPAYIHPKSPPPKIVVPGQKPVQAPRPPRTVVNASALLIDLPPDFPDPDELPHPSTFTLFIQRPKSSKPVVNVFPDDLLAKIRPAEWTGHTSPAEGTWAPPRGSFAHEWKSPDYVKLGDSSGLPALPQIQFDFPAEEDRDATRLKLVADRREVVRNAFLHAWEGYKRQAWGSDEVRPVTGLRSDPFMGWGASIIDTLDTLLVMRLPEEYLLAREHVRDVDFGIISGLDWGRGPNRIGRKEASIHAFETVIRYVGGLLGAYDLSGDPLLLKRAEELAKIILPVFDTSSGVPLSRLNAKTPLPVYGGHSIQLAEAGTLALEYTRLAQITGNRTYFDLAQRGMDYLDQVLAPKSTFQPLLPSVFSTEAYRGGMMGTFSFGGQADSYYEYLIKQHVLLRGAVPRYAQLYSRTIDKAEDVLFKQPPVAGKKLMTVGEIKSGRYQYAMEHLSCFTGAMMALGAKVLDYRKRDLYNAKRISQTCYFIGSATASGLQPERVDFYEPDAPRRIEKVIDADTQEIFDIPRGKPQGVKSMHKHYISRPESLESVFYMYRITGDERYQDQGWRMFTDWISQTRTDHGFASVEDVGQRGGKLKDNMESFVLAETFKYYYLLQSDTSDLSLDTYVLNTEAHPFIHSPKHTPGDSGLFDLSLIPEGDEDLEVGQGTHAQKWAVHAFMKESGMFEEKEEAKAAGGA